MIKNDDLKNGVGKWVDGSYSHVGFSTRTSEARKKIEKRRREVYRRMARYT